MLDVKTGKVLPDTDPIMVTVNRVWDNGTSFAQRKAFIEVTLKNCRNPFELKLATEVIKLFEEAAKNERFDTPEV